jgi:hypothetical protein
VERGRVVEVDLLATVVDAAGSDWRAAAWVLERRWPERWARAGRRPEEPPLGPEEDDLDELAGRRDARRAAR